MDYVERGRRRPSGDGRQWLGGLGGFLAVAGLFLLVATPFLIYRNCFIHVPEAHMAILIKKTGKDLPSGEEIAPSTEYKGLQKVVLGDGRYMYNPYSWSWEVVPMINIPQDKIGVRIRLYGENLPYGEIIARDENSKGIVPEVLQPGRYAINAWVAGAPKRARDNYAEYIELHDPVMIPAGYKGVVTKLSSPLAKQPNVMLVRAGERGAQQDTLEPGRYPVNPYTDRVQLIDCRSKKFTLSEGGEMGFPSKDGFWVTLDGVIEFRVMPDKAALVYVTYNQVKNDQPGDARVDEEIIESVILPNARSFCRLRGSDHSGKEFITGDTRTKFQEDFQKEIERTCEAQGIEIIQALITNIYPPQKIAKPVRDRQLAQEKSQQYEREIVTQEAEQQLAMKQELIKQKQALVQSEQEVVGITTAAERAQEVALIEANQRLKVAELELRAAADLAAAILSRGDAAAKVIEFENQAEAAGWKKAVGAFGGDGHEYARWVMLKKLAPAFRQMMVNTADSPIMNIFRDFEEGKGGSKSDVQSPPKPMGEVETKSP